MGIDANAVRFLLYARSAGVSFERTATIGRQAFFASPRSLRRVLRDFGRCEPAGTLLGGADGFADPLLRLLGARELRSFDRSAYEGATDLHDFNFPVPEALHEAFSAVVDAGTLEHVFQYPTALASCMEMTKVGGHLLLVTPTNQYAGHGFYQLSPELFFRALDAAQGFSIERAFLFEDRPRAAWYEAVDPSRIARRVPFSSRRRTLLAVLARRIAKVTPFRTAPVQADYAEAWKEGKAGEGGSSGLLPAPWRVLVDAARSRGWLPRLDPRGFRRVRIPDRRTRAAEK